MHHLNKYAFAKTGEYPNDIPQLSKWCMLQEIFVLGHCLF